MHRLYSLYSLLSIQPIQTILAASMAADKSQEKQYVNILFDETLLKRLDDYRFKHRFPSRTEAVRWLLDAALKAKLAPKEE